MKKANSLENASHVIYIMKQNVQAKFGHWKLTGLKLKHSVHKLRQIPWIIQKNVTSISSKTANEGKRFFALWIYSLKMFPANLSGFVTRHKDEKKCYLNGKKIDLHPKPMNWRQPGCILQYLWPKCTVKSWICKRELKVNV